MDAIRAWRHHRQGLDGSYGVATAAEVLQRAGWARSVGGVGPYVSLYSRCGIRRREADRAILDRGNPIGFWEYDVETQSIAWMTNDGMKAKALIEAVRRVEEYVREDLGDARSFSLDSPKSRAGRIAEIRRRNKTKSLS